METGKIEFFTESLPDQEKSIALMEKLVDVGQAETVFSQPVESGEYKVLTASSVSVAMGFGYSRGGGESISEKAESENEEASSPSIWKTMGGGGGGASAARPVAAIELGPNGVRVEPIVDITKIGLAFITMMISMITIVAKARRLASR